MECTLAPAQPATAVVAAAPRHLVAAFAAVPAPRRAASIVYALPGLLALAVTAILANQHSPLAMAEWAARPGAAVLEPLGFVAGRVPWQPTLHRLLALKRGHGGIENGLHFVKDRTCGEDQSLVYPGAGPTIMAMLRDTAVSLLHRAGCRAIASRLRAHADRPQVAVALVVGANPTHA